MRRRALPVLAATGAWAVCLMGAAPAAVAEDVQSKQWYLDAMQAQDMWKVSTGKGIKVAVVDTGVNPSTPSLRGQVLSGRDVAGVSGGAHDDYDGHGTTMAELIAGTGKGGGLQGLAPDAKIFPVRTALSSLKNKPDEDTIAPAIRAAADSDAQIINMSISGVGTTPQIEKAVEYAAGKGKLMFAGTGNDGEGKSLSEYPAAYPEVIGVGSVDSTGTVSKFSTHGNTVSVAAPGSDVPKWCDKTLKSYCDGEGTSAATAIASASAALIWSKHRDWNANQVARVLVGTTDGVMENRNPSKYVGYGAVRPRLNLLEGKGEPGNPKQPAFLSNGDFDTSKDAFEKPDAAPGKGEEAGSGKADAGSQADPAKASSGDNSTLWTSLGIGAAVIVLGGGAFAFLRARRG
ncbi:S8 family serine peptidase [Streptomyces sp. NPDC053542]|uniref:S8 family serine peptidase n=1 Tax=Streptomyces sp. NPDC053542 TaxID=3365710 RepID=UPI0037D069BA